MTMAVAIHFLSHVQPAVERKKYDLKSKNKKEIFHYLTLLVEIFWLHLFLAKEEVNLNPSRFQVEVIEVSKFECRLYIKQYF